jgi:gas vesicle protein
MFIKDFIDQMRHSRSDRENALRRDKAGILALGVSIGCTVGAVAGLLLAPRSGKETRDDVTRYGSEAWDKIKDNVSANCHRLVHTGEEKGNRVRTAAEKDSGAAKKSLHESSTKAEKTVPKQHL